MINKSNYIEKVKGIDFSQLPAHLKKGHEYIIEATENGADWSAYDDEDIQRVMNTYFTKLNEYLEKNQSVKPTKEVAPPKSSAQVKHIPQPAKPAPKAKPAPVEEDEDDFEFVERIPDEIRFLRRYVALNGKRKTKDDLLKFINALHRAIIEKRVRKTSPYAKQINYIQDKLVKTYNSMTKALSMQVSEKVIADFKSLIAEQKVMPSVQLIKRYISLNGKFVVKDRAKLLMDAMTKAFNNGKITKSDKYYKIFDNMHYNLSQYVKNKSQKILSIQEPELNGLNGVLAGCNCGAVNGKEDDTLCELNGLERTAEVVRLPSAAPGIMNSMDFKNMQFKTIGFVGKYRSLIGDPAKGFTAMVFGKPKMGKSYLCVDFAGYLASNHGKVLYIAKEEGLDITLQEKLKAKDVAHPNLDIAEEIPQDISAYDFIFFDSVNKLGLSAHDLEAIKNANPDKCFIYIFQTTKEGNFRGANEFQHDVDIVIEVPQKGLAVQNGRYNQGGEMRIFDNPEYSQAA